MKKHVSKVTHAGLRDRTGHLSAEVAADLRSRSQTKQEPAGGDRAYFREPQTGDPWAEQLGEGFVAAATGNDDALAQTPEEIEVEDAGGPFVESTDEAELALGADESNPPDATREPFPRT